MRIEWASDRLYGTGLRLKPSGRSRQVAPLVGNVIGTLARTALVVGRPTRPAMRNLAKGPRLLAFRAAPGDSGGPRGPPRYQRIPEDAGGFGPTSGVRRPKRKRARRRAHAILIDPIGFEDFLAGAAAGLDF